MAYSKSLYDASKSSVVRLSEKGKSLCIFTRVFQYQNLKEKQEDFYRSLVIQRGFPWTKYVTVEVPDLKTRKQEWGLS